MEEEEGEADEAGRRHCAEEGSCRTRRIPLLFVLRISNCSLLPLLELLGFIPLQKQSSVASHVACSVARKKSISIIFLTPLTPPSPHSGIREYLCSLEASYSKLH